MAVPAGAGAAAWLMLVAAGNNVPELTLLTLGVYGLGLVGMLTASALYNMAGHGPRKEILRRVDHAMIFVMIAGTYTPFAIDAIGGATGAWLMASVWGGAAMGVALKLCFPRRLERLGLVLYLVLGWAVVVTFRPLLSVLSDGAFVLLIAGGVIYTVGAGVHTLQRVPFHNAAWHAMVLAAATCHFAAIWLQFA